MGKFVEKEILMVKNPITGKSINILPMLQFLSSETLTTKANGGEAGYLLIDEAIKILVTNYSDNDGIGELKDMAYNLYQLRDVFNEMKEI
ncbi:MAG: hypothetical protein MUF12_07345 [Sediminibacterium sp.]|jgi:hypothetical protein|nr:hypothetical protein [Sediminibacterium sp.]